MSGSPTITLETLAGLRHDDIRPAVLQAVRIDEDLDVPQLTQLRFVLDPRPA